ncbi:hypothetical protein SAMN05877962_11145 [Alloalcanivorax xenomutans]|uniref:hypothetical protein n=1 Tax=Alloalcanivorax xenomutans TaxID=1094342 RepID=UPI000BCCD4F3|nr:hypothetical protein [Alloalcanivorax xenomutans]SOC12089.1 hypothetical protein SAMN05877962_11145 [Alloalcanivorax xenomutans]
MSLFTIGSTRARALTPVLLASALAACGGGGSSGSGGGQEPFVSLNNENTGPLLYLALEGSLGMVPVQMHAIMLPDLEGECTQGSITVVYGTNDIPTSATANNCTLSGENTDPVTLAGTVRYDFEGDSTLEVDTSGFNLVAGNPVEANILISGEFDYVMDAVDHFADTDLQIDAQGPSQSGEGKYNANWHVEDLKTTWDYSSENVTYTVEGTLLVNGRSEKVSITTAEPLTRNLDQEFCPESGEIRLRGANNTHAEVLVEHRDGIVVTINGVATNYTCEQFEAYMIEAENSFIQ